MFEQHITYRFLDRLHHMEYGAVTVTTPDGKKHSFTGKHPGATADLTLHDWRAIAALAAKGDIGFAESYRDGWWDSSNLVNLLLAGLQNERAIGNYIYGGMLSQFITRVAYLFNRNTVRGSKKNIHAHYDIGNDFYQLWLDETMTYSSAIFSHADQPLVPAQYNKYDRIVERLHQKGNLLEIGCGWGGFAERALQTNDYDIKGVTISEAQYFYAKNRLRGSAHIALEDYRLQQGKYQNIVSIEMFEAVGERFWPIYFSKLKSLLADKGRAMIQTITIDEHYFPRYRKGGDAIRTFIFPGGMLPSHSRFVEQSRKAGLRVCDSFAFGQNYARTMEYWLQAFETRRSSIKALGFDEKFIRLWRFYLTCCIASFKTGRTNVMQMELQHAA